MHILGHSLFVSISRSLRTREIRASSGDFMKIHRLLRLRASWLRRIPLRLRAKETKPRFPKEGNAPKSPKGYEYEFWTPFPETGLRWGTLKVVQFQ